MTHHVPEYPCPECRVIWEEGELHEGKCPICNTKVIPEEESVCMDADLDVG